jgi:hypothetical protein
MGRRLTACAFVPAALLAAAAALSAPAAKPDEPTKQDAARRHERIVKAYLDSRWDELAEATRVPTRERNLLTKPQREEIQYVRKAAGECRPAWWQACKRGKECLIRPTVWGRRLRLKYVPDTKTGWSSQPLGGRQLITVKWDPRKMDSAEPADASMAAHGCTAGDMADLSVQQMLAQSYVMGSMSPQRWMALYRKDKLGFQRYQIFQGNVAALYHCSPRSRHAALVIYLAAFMPKYGSGPLGGTRRAVGSMFVAKVLADPSKWPSLPVPRNVGEDDAEAKAAVFYKMRIGKAWTLDEDRALRAATLAFHKANGADLLRTGKVVLPNKLVVALDPQKDQPYKAKRDAWVAEQLKKARKAEP